MSRNSSETSLTSKSVPRMSRPQSISFRSTRSMTPRKPSSRPIGTWIGRGLAATRVRSSATALSGSAPTRSILLMYTILGTLYLSACLQTVSDWGSTPPTPHKIAIAPSRTLRERSTSAVKSTCPGVSMILIRWSIPRARRRGGSDGDPALLLLDHPVHDRRPVVHLSHLVGDPRVEEDPLRRGGLPRIDMGHDADIPHVLDRVRPHVLYAPLIDVPRRAARKRRLPFVMSEGPVGFRHLMGVFPLLDRAAPVVDGVDDLRGELLRHALPVPFLGVFDEPTDAQRE